MTWQEKCAINYNALRSDLKYFVWQRRMGLTIATSLPQLMIHKVATKLAASEQIKAKWVEDED